MKSLKIQLLTYVLSVFTLALILLFIVSYNETVHEIEEVFDAELAQTARMISQLTLANIDSKGLDLTTGSLGQGAEHKYEKHVSYQVWYKNALVLRSDSAPDQPLSTGSGYSNININGKQWRVFALYPESSPYRIYTAEDNRARDELAWEIVIESLEVYFWSLPALAILIFMTVNRGLRSLDRLSGEMREQNINQLEPLNRDQVPREVLPLVNAINELLARLESAMQRERRFTSDASHELRTPLSGIKLHAQLAMKATSDSEREHSLQQIISAVDQSSRLAEQLLTLSRIEPGGPDISAPSVNVSTICQRVIDEITGTPNGKGANINLHQPAEEPIEIEADEGLLHNIFRNLIDNAVRYSGEDARVDIEITKTDGYVEINIQDNGPGVPASQINNLTERFYRIAGQEIPGCGLGLAIVSEAVNRLNGNLRMQNRTDHGEGFKVIVQLPA